MSQSGDEIQASQKSDGMLKSKLQEFCQQRSWPLPKYTTFREGPSHGPYFKATVVVNGLVFETSDFFKRAKEAQIEAAKIALAHFTSPAAPAAVTVGVQRNFPAPDTKLPVPTEVQCTGIEGDSGINSNLNKRPRSMTDEISTSFVGEKVQSSENASNTKRNKHSGELNIYKNQLQIFVLKKGFSLPIYTSEREGPPHNSRFKSKVTIGGQTYESASYFCTLKESEHAAAKVALESLVPAESQDASLDKSIFKNLLQEFAQKSGLKLPIYKTTGSGANHLPTFVSTVIVGGETFSGEEAKTKKHAEMNAAKVAYTSLSQRANLGPSGSAPICTSKAIPGSSLNSTSDLGETNQLGVSPKLVRSQCVTEPPTGGTQATLKQTPCAGIGSKNSFGSPNLEKTTISSPLTHADPWVPSEYIHLSQDEGSSPQAPSEVLHSSVSNSNVDTFSSLNSSPRYLVHVYPRALSMDFQSGAVVRHCDDKWIAVSFPANQPGH